MRKKQGLHVPEHMANSLYLEWFSEYNGRVVVESSDYKLTVSPSEWQLTAQEEKQRQRDAASGFSFFMEKLSEAIESVRHEPPEDKKWDEFDYEKLMKESDARTDKFMELLDKYEDDPNSDEIIAREMGWDKESDDEDGELAEEEKAERAAMDVDEMNRICEEAIKNPVQPDPKTEGIDWIRGKEDDIGHPLYFRAFAASSDLWHKCKELGLSKSDDDELGEMITQFQITTAKLAGALNSLGYGRNITDGPFVVACLKRALNHLHTTQAALEKVAPKDLLPPDLLENTRTELFEIREEILRLMDEFRK
jgi:hypothetical protein